MTFRHLCLITGYGREEGGEGYTKVPSRHSSGETGEGSLGNLSEDGRPRCSNSRFFYPLAIQSARRYRLDYGSRVFFFLSRSVGRSSRQCDLIIRPETILNVRSGL